MTPKRVIILIISGILLAALITVAYALVWVWIRSSNQALTDQPSLKPLEAPGPRPTPKDAVPAGGAGPAPESKEAAARLINPVEPTDDAVARGENLYMVHCVTCHGATGRGNGIVGEKLRIPPANLVLKYVQEQPDGELYFTLTNGGSAMPAFDDALTPLERWHIISFVKKRLPDIGEVSAADDF